MQELLQSVVASDRSRAADMPAKWGDTLYPDYDFVYVQFREEARARVTSDNGIVVQ